ncbi:protein FAM204A [Pelodytes ibericus]
MWSGLLLPGMRESDLSEDEEEAEKSEVNLAGLEGPKDSVADQGQTTCPVGVPENCFNKFLDLQKKCCEFKFQASRNEKRRRRQKGKRKKKPSENTEKITSPPPVKNAALETLQTYFGSNDRFEPPVCNKILKKSRLEDALDEAVTLGEIETAEELSDKMATREMAVKITKAMSCHKYLKAKEQEDISESSQKKKKNLGWGFEAKKRWETKSNMGYM